MQSSLGTYHSSAHPRSPNNPVYHHICELVADTRGCSCSGNVYHRNTYLGLDLSLKTVKSVNAENKTKFSKICDILRKKGHVATVASPFRSSVFHFLAKCYKICEIFFSCEKKTMKLSLLHKIVNISSHKKR